MLNINKYMPYLSGHPKLLLSTLVISTPLAYLVYFHHILSQKTHHTASHGTLTRSISENISSIPESAFALDHIMVHDKATKTILKSLSPTLDSRKLLVLYLRHTMSLFSSRFPQAYMLRLMSTPEARETFNRNHIASLGFKEGDLVCGVYQVALRTGNKVEFEMKTVGVVQGGRLVISIEEGDDEWICSTETVMWKRRGEKGLMPLERSLVRWMHECASRWLLDAGTRYLLVLKDQISHEE